MDENKETKEIDLIELLGVLWHRIVIIIISALVGAGCFLGWTYFMVTPLYKSSALMYVNNSSISIGSSSISISPSEISAAKSLVDTYVIVLKTRSTLEKVIAEANLNYSYEQIQGMIDADSVNSTEIFKVTVTSPDPYEAEKIANTIALVLPEKISDIVEGSDVRVVDYAVVPSGRSSPSYTRNTAIGLLVGLFISVAVIVLIHLFDTIIRNEDSLVRKYNIPILTSIPDMTSSSNGHGYGKYGKSGKYGKYSKYYAYSYGKQQNGNPSGGKKETGANGSDYSGRA